MCWKFDVVTFSKSLTSWVRPLCIWKICPSKLQICHFQDFQVIFGNFMSFWGYLELFLGQNSKLSQTSHVTTQNNRKRSRNLMEMVSDVTFPTFRSFLAILYHFGAIWNHFWPPKKGRLDLRLTNLHLTMGKICAQGERHSVQWCPFILFSDLATALSLLKLIVAQITFSKLLHSNKPGSSS